jgi:hypothetical protein
VRKGEVTKRRINCDFPIKSPSSFGLVRDLKKRLGKSYIDADERELLCTWTT